MDLTPLKCIAETSGRETFITDGNFNLLWTNSRKQLVQILQGSDLKRVSKPIKKEICLKCPDGRALKVTPVTKEERTELYVFELYEANDLITMLMATPIVEKYRNKFAMLRTMMGRYLDDTVNLTHIMNIDDFEKLRSHSANRLAFLSTLSDEREKRINDIGAYLNGIAGYLEKFSISTNKFDFDYSIESGLYSDVALSSLEYAVINMFSNAYEHSAVEKTKKIIIRAYKKNDQIILETEDNGTDADLKKIESYRNINTANVPDNDDECIGISLLEMFARKFDGTLDFRKSETGGLISSISLPCAEYDEVFDLSASSSSYQARMLCMEILKGHFDTIEKSDIIAPFSYH